MTTLNVNLLITYLLRVIGAALIFSLPVIVTQSGQPNQLEKIIASGKLHVVSRNGPTTFFEGPHGYQGIEYELAAGFAKELGVELVMLDSNNLIELLDSIGNGADFAAAGLTITPDRENIMNFTEPYMSVTEQLIYRRGNLKPSSIAELENKEIWVIEGSSHINTLREHKKKYPNITWREVNNIEMIELMEMIHDGEIEYAIIDSHVYSINQAIYPRARVALDISGEKHLAWAFPKSKDDSLLQAAKVYLNSRETTRLARALKKKYFLNENGIDHSNALTLVQRMEDRLPKWAPLFQEVANEFELDWLFLAAISYQESHWNPKAKSPTGVRGMMMLTRATASDLGIKDRTDPAQSIYGGAKYYTQVLNRIPDSIKGQNRKWMALAAYNVGFGHLQDARKLARQLGKNPDLWSDVKEVLPLLSKPKYYKNTRHGYARGWEPVEYVENIRQFHNVLTQYHQIEKRKNIANQKSEEEKELLPVDYSQAEGLSVM